MKVKENKPLQFDGPFAARLYSFIAYKQALGYKYYTVAEILSMFDIFSKSHSASGGTLTKELVSAWIEKRPDEKPQTQMGRTTAIREFGNYLDSIGIAAYTPPKGTGARVQRYTPYIFTHSEIARLFAAADRQRVLPQYPKSHLTAPAIIRLLYGCGVRVSEAFPTQ